MILKLLSVLVFLVFMLFIMYVIEYYNINMDPLKKPVKIEEITVETFVSDENIKEPFDAEPFDFCKEYRENNPKLDEACKTVDKFDSCMEKTCCIWGGEIGLPDIKKNGNCLLGNDTGPIFKGSAFDNTEYYYQGIKYPQ